MQSHSSPPGTSTSLKKAPAAAVAATTTTTTQLQTLTSGDSIRASVNHLLARAFSLPCSTAALAFTQLVQPTSRFQLALDALLPILDSNTSAEQQGLTIDVHVLQLAQRILVSFILYSLYTPHPVTINPFKSALLVAYVREREKAVSIANEGGVSPNEQFVWVLWKILKGDGNDVSVTIASARHALSNRTQSAQIGPYSPSTLSRCPLPPKLRAINLVLDEELYNSISDIDDSTYHYFVNKRRLSASSDTDESTTNSTHTHTYIHDSRSPVPRAISDTPSRSPVNFDEDRKNERLIHAMKLLLAARDRVLSLSEQRMLVPIIPDLANTNIITSIDLAPIIAHNPTIAHPLLVALLTNPNPEKNNPLPFLDVIPFLPPTLATFDLFGRLLRDQTRVTVQGYSTVADLVLIEVLARFVHECINWLDHAEREEREGNISDDRFAKGVQNLCRFYNSLIKFNIVDPTADADSTEMAHFSLRNARFEEANNLYRVIATSRF
ncbi:hypothetical protein JR316_0010539 [Psilocybe cubensis]|uniref:Uncharacterized protein n=1 Tax=Psilocybe cubensis TaxID=181762 RepID=A0ACB8GM55_PSICU|nr:hypothetical protein JR316_0010539 [Psilocybe cubensis]KAH9476626.1 hypothetical protein JR316_0010539 [Psilocybe cubensis]